MNKGIIKNKFLNSIVILLFPGLMVGVLGPLEVYSGNTGELFFGTGDFVFLFAVITLSLVIAGAFILSFLPVKLRRFFHAFILAVSVAAFLQNNVFNLQLMKTDGSKIDWSIYKNYTIANTVFWVAGIIMTVNIFLAAKKKLMNYTAVIFSLLQVVAIISIMISSPFDVKSSTMSVLDSRDEFSVAKGNNVIVLILDKYGNNTFDNAMEDNSEFASVYKDFTYYNNANSKYNYTFPSIPYMLTLVDPDCSITTNEYKRKAWTTGKSSEFHDLLKDKGYTYNFYTGSDRACFLDPANLKGSVDNIRDVENVAYKIDKANMLFLLTKTSLYKYAPYIIKPKLEVQSFYFDGIVSFEGFEPCIESNSAYYRKLCDEGLNINQDMDNAVIITHLYGIHTPFNIDENANQVDESETDVTKVQLGLNTVLAKYFEELKRLGLYDNATIIITADHGLYKDALDPQPIYLIKPAGQIQDKMSINEAPISSEDMLPTLLYIAGADYSEFGTPVFMISPDNQRERKCMYPDKGFQVYTYTGGRGDLRSKIEHDDYTRIDATEDWD